MNFTDLPLPSFFMKAYLHPTLTPIQEKAIHAGVLEGKSLLVCAPTASGKTLVASFALAQALGTGKILYLVPLKALAKEKYREYQKLLQGTSYKVAIATGDKDEGDSPYLSHADVLILTTEKLDSLLRHHVPWLPTVKVMIVDEIHLLNDSSRGPTLEIILTLTKLFFKPQLIGLSATIGNPEKLAQWLNITLIQDSWRPVKLRHGILREGKVTYYKES